MQENTNDEERELSVIPMNKFPECMDSPLALEPSGNCLEAAVEYPVSPTVRSFLKALAL